MNELQQLPSVRSLLQESWQRLRKNVRVLAILEGIVWIPISIALVFTLLVVIPSVKDVISVPSLLQEQAGDFQKSIPFSSLSSFRQSMVGVSWIFVLCVMVVRMLVSIGQVLLLANEDTMTVTNTLRHGWHRLLPTIGNGLLMMLIFLPLLILMSLPFLGAVVIAYLLISGASSDVLDTVKTIAFIGGGSLIVVLPVYFLLFVRLSFVMLLVAIGETTSAWKESWNLTKGKFWAIFWRLGAGTFVIGLIGSTMQAIVNQLFLSVGGDTSVRITASFIGATFGILVQFVLVLFGTAYSVSLLRNTQKITY